MPPRLYEYEPPEPGMVSIYDVDPGQLAYYDPDPSIRLEVDALMRDLERVLDEKQFFVLKHRYELGGAPLMSLSEIGKRYSVSRQRVEQIGDEALRQLKWRLPPWYGPERDTERHRTSASLRSRSDLDQILRDVMEPIEPDQALALIHYYGLLGEKSLPVKKIAETLGLSELLTRFELCKGQKALLEGLSMMVTPVPEFDELRQQLREDIEAEVTVDRSRHTLRRKDILSHVRRRVRGKRNAPRQKLERE